MDLRDLLKLSQPAVWKQNGAVYWLHQASSEPSKFVPTDPRDLNRVVALVKSLHKATISESPVAELEQEEIEEELLPLLKHD